MSQAFIDSPPSTAISKVRRMISTVRLAESRLLKPTSPQRYPYATGFGSKSMHTLDQRSPETPKSGYLMVLDKRKGRSNLSWILEHCVITADSILASISGNARQPRPFLHLAACSFRMINGNKHTGRGFSKKNIVEVMDRDTNMPLVYLQAKTKEETRAWLFELRVHVAQNQQKNNSFLLQNSYCSSSLGLDNSSGNDNGGHSSFVEWGENNDTDSVNNISSSGKNGETDAERCRNCDECLDCAHGNAIPCTSASNHKCSNSHHSIQPSATALLASSSSLSPSSSLHKPPSSLVQAAARRGGPSGSLDLTRGYPGDRFKPSAFPLHYHHHTSPNLYTLSQDKQQQQQQQQQQQPQRHLMNDNTVPTADPAAVSVITAGVLYLQTYMEDEPKPVPHYLHTKGSSRWRAFIGVLARCSDSVGFFLLDADDSARSISQQHQVRVVAELDVRLLSTHDTQPLNDSLFGSSFAFSIRARQVSDGTLSDSMRAYFSDMPAENFGPESMAKFGDDNDNDNISVFSRSTVSKTDTSDSKSKLGVCFEDAASDKQSSSDSVSQQATFGAKWTPAAGGLLPTDKIANNKERSKSLGDLIDFGDTIDVGGHDQIGAELNEQHAGLGNEQSAVQRAKSVHPLPYVLYLSTMRATERSSWIHHLRRFSRSPMLIKQVDAKPQSIVYRIERSLWIGVCEIRGLAQQKSDREAKPTSTVSAILSLDGSPIACCDVPRMQTNGVRRESPTHQFLFGSLPPVRDGMSVVFRVAGETKRGETSLSSSTGGGGGGGLLGYCHIPVPFMQRESTYDGWYPLSYGPVGAIDRRLRPYVALASNVKPTNELLCTANQQTHHDQKEQQQVSEPTTPSIPFRSGDARIQVRYDELVVLARPFYSGILEHMFDTNPTIIFDITAGIPRSADWLVETLAKIALATGKFERWIEALVKHELQSLSVRDPALIFRGASVTTRAMDTLMKVCGLSFLDQMIGEIVRAVTDSEHKCEVDPAKLSDDESIDDHWEMLTQLLQALWRAIEESKHQCPVEMRRAFYRIRLAIIQFYTEDGNETDKSAQGNVRYSCVSGFMFLRLLCPAMLSPRSFGLVSNAPSVSSLRTLTLLAKGIQCTANLTDFAQKEPYMQPMNKVIQQSIPKMKSFIDYIASGEIAQTSGSAAQEVDSAAIASVVDGERELAALCVFVSGAQDEIKELIASAIVVYSLPPPLSAQTPLPRVLRRGSVSGPSSPTTALDPVMESPEAPANSKTAAVADGSAGEAGAAGNALVAAGGTTTTGGGSVRGMSTKNQLQPFRKASDGYIPMRRKASHLMMLDLSYQIPTISLPAMSKRESGRHYQHQALQPPPMKIEAPAIRESSIKSVEELLRLCQVIQDLSNFCKQQ
ncbi:GTPase activating factor [Coemansia sp. RSA 1843]|nr:GTPase activating factor [Coemansia sp. RSA 1843]